MKLGFLFGAGAEVGYGLPSGGKFALDIFRFDSSKSKQAFKEMREEIDKKSKYANNWLPDDYINKNISSYGKTVFESIIKDTIEYNREKIVSEVNRFDEYAERQVDHLEKEYSKNIKNILESILGKDIDEFNMGQTVSFIDVFSDGNKLFNNNYFSVLLEIYKDKTSLNSEQRNELGKIITSIIQLQIGALSEKLTRNINDSIFKKKDEEIDLFDDLGEVIRLNYQATGLSGMEYLLENRKSNTNTDAGMILRFAQGIIEDIYASVLDYKTLIDSNWRYLYSPKYDWAKFCKICIFLMTVREYILVQSSQVDISSLNGYYHHLKEAINGSKLEISKIATTNYNSFISDITDEDVTYLNGATSLWYDPYLNKIIEEVDLDKGEKHFCLPLMFTQSGTKPMTSIDMSIKYVNTYNEWKNSDALVVIGFGFNADDEHINGIIRTLVNDDNKMLAVVTLKDGKDESTHIKSVCDKLKLTNKTNIKIIFTDGKSDNEKWIDEILNSLM